MLVNGSQFAIYNSDSEDTIIQRIARDLHSTIFWLYIEFDKDTLTDSNNVKAINIIMDIKQNSATFVSFKDLEIKYKKWIDKSKDDEPLTKLATFYVLTSTENDEVLDFSTKIILEDFFVDSGGTDFNWDFINDVLNNRFLYINKLNQDIRDTAKRADKLEEEMKKIQHDITADVSVDHTQFKVVNIVKRLHIRTTHQVVLTHILDDLQSNNILFARYNRFFKIFTKNRNLFLKYDYDEELSPNSLMIVLFNYLKNKPVFKEIIIEQISQYEYVIDVDIDSDDTGNTSYVDEIRNVLLVDFEVLKQTNVRIKGTFSLLNTSFHKEMFLDEIMNNDYFFNLYCNERFKVTKTFNRINLYMYSLKTNSVSFSIGKEDNGILIKVNKIQSFENVDYFLKYFVSLFARYKSREKLLYNIYKKFIPSMNLNNERDFNKNDLEKTKNYKIKKNILSLQEPTLFVPLYTRKCAKPPRILDDDEVAPDGFDVMTFPRFNEGGVKERKYVCDQTGHFKFPGVRKNTLSNSHIFKYIPCCYETNQEVRKGSPWNAYFKGAKEKNEKYEHVLYKTSRILPNHNKGILPSAIVRAIGNLNRRGVFIGPNSFIDCISRIVSKQDIDSDDERSRRKTLNQIRKELSPEVCMQDNSDLPNFREWFANKNLYFEPRRFYRAVEEYFKVNIFIFEKSAKHVEDYRDERLIFQKTNNNGILAKPNMPPQGIYIDPKKYNKNAAVFVHMGSSVDSLNFPHCEIIEIFGHDKSVIECNILNIYRNLLIFSRTDYIDAALEKQIAKQYTDTMGRTVRIETKDKKVVDFQQPMLPVKAHSEQFVFEDRSDDELATFNYMKRMARLFVEYCLLKFTNSSYETIDEFIDNVTEVDSTKQYSAVSPNVYSIAYYDNIFSENGKVIFESEDTKKRIEYSMKIFFTKNGGVLYNRSVLLSFFENNLDFSQTPDYLVTNEKAFKSFAFEKPAGYALNNCLDTIPTNVQNVIIKNNVHVNLNGYFGIFYTLDDLLLKIKCSSTTENSLQQDVYYMWNESHYDEYTTEGEGRIVLIYRFNSTTYFLGKYSNIF